MNINHSIRTNLWCNLSLGITTVVKPEDRDVDSTQHDSFSVVKRLRVKRVNIFPSLFYSNNYEFTLTCIMDALYKTNE